MRIEIDDLTRPEVQRLLTDHLADMSATSPAESMHALDLEGLRAPGLTLWTLWEGDALLGCAALKQLDARTGEVKSMRTAVDARGRGVGARLLEQVIAEARGRGYERISLETGSQPFFDPALRLYARFGFVLCPPFAQYRLDPNSVFLTLEL